MVRFVLVVSFSSPLFEPEAFHTGNYTIITQQCGCLFYKQKSPREEAILNLQGYCFIWGFCVVEQ